LSFAFGGLFGQPFEQKVPPLQAVLPLVQQF